MSAPSDVSEPDHRAAAGVEAGRDPQAGHFAEVNAAWRTNASAPAFADIQACAASARDDCSYSRGDSGVAVALPRQQPSRRARRTTGSPRLSSSH